MTNNSRIVLTIGLCATTGWLIRSIYTQSGADFFVSFVLCLVTLILAAAWEK